MADSIVGGLFGMTPEMYQQEQNQQALGQAAKLAQMSPLELAKTGIGYGANRLAGAIGGALGGQDPQLQLISQRNALAQQFDTSTTQGLAGLANALRERNDVAGATQVAQALMTARQKEGELAAKMREHLSPNQKDAAGIADSQYSRNDPKWMETYGTELSRLTTKEFAPSIDKVGVAASTREPVYYDKKTDLQYIMKPDATGKMVRVPYSGGIDQTTSRTNVSVTNEGEKAFVKQLGELDAKRVETASTLRDSAIGELNSLSRMQNLNQNELVSGAFASNRVGALNLLDTLGMTGIKDKAALANSQQFDKVTGDLILDKIKKLGSNPSNADREFTKNIVPQLASSPVARQELITYLSKKANEVVDETTRLETYARKNKGLEGFTYKVPLVSSNTQSKPAIQNLSTEQLQKMLKEVP
jgi:hypothetical protein